MTDVFISYSKTARPLTEALAAWLQGQNLSVWWDTELASGQSFRHEIRRQLVAAKAVIVIWSEAATTSDWVYAEAAVAARSGRLVSLFAENVTDTDLPLPFGVFHLTSIEDRAEILRAVRGRIEGRLEPATAVEFDPRWAGFWLLDPHQTPFDPSDANPSPASLVLARHALVPFMELGGELTDFLHWAKGTGSAQSRKPVCARVLHGAGGLGKTRLMIELCAKLADAGWLAGFIPPNLIGKGFEVSQTKLRSLIENGNGARPLFVVMDYAESRRADVEWVCQCLLHRREKRGAPARLVLLSRSVGEWWTELFGDPDVQKLFCLDNGEPDVSLLAAADDAFTPDKRLALFDSSIQWLKRVLQEAGRATPTASAAPSQIQRVISGADNARPLAIQIEALLHLYGEAPDDARLSIDKLLDRVLRLETSSWSRRLKINEERERQQRVARGVCQTTLATGIDTKDSAIALLKLYERCSHAVADKIHYDLHTLYGTEGGGLLPLEPDLIGEHHVANSADQRLIDTCLDWAGDYSQRRRAILTVLNRATRDEHGPHKLRALDHLRKLLEDPRVRSDLVAVAISTPGKLSQLLKDQREALSPPVQEAIQQSVKQERLNVSRGSGLIADPRDKELRALENAFAPDEETRVFISRAASDREIAVKIASILQEQGFNVVTQDWDFANRNFMERLHSSLGRDGRVIALLSPSYLASEYCAAEWMSVVASDPLNRSGRLILLRVAPCEPKGLLRTISYYDLVPFIQNRDKFAEAVLHAVTQTDALPIKALLHHMIKPEPTFVAREEQLLEINSTLWSTAAHDTVFKVGAVISGLGGIGKSSLAREYAWRAQGSYSGVWWLNGSGEDILIEGLIELGGVYVPNLGRTSDRAAAARHTLDFLSHGGFDKPWLLIFDDVEDPQLLARWRPGSGVHVLVTSRVGGWASDLSQVRTGKWTIDEAVAYLRTEIMRDDIGTAEFAEIAEKLGCLPLALSHAAAYLRNNPNATAVSYLANLDRQLQRAPEESDYGRSVYATFRAAIDRAESRAPGTSAVLSLAAFMAPDDIPGFLFQQAPELYPRELRTFVSDPVKLHRAFNVLNDVGLIEADLAAFSVHRLVQAAARERLGNAGIAWANKVAAILQAAFPQEHSLQTWATCSQLSRHARALLEYVGASEPARDLAVSIGDAAEALAPYVGSEEALAALETSSVILARLSKLQPSHTLVQHDFVNANDRLADVLVEKGNLPAALDRYQASLAIRDRLATADPGNVGWQRDLSVSHDRIGDVLRAQGDLPAALDSYQASLAIRDRLATADPGNASWQRDLSVSHNKIGDVIRAQGNLPAALDSYKASLAIADRLAKADPGNAGWQRDPSVSQDKIGDVLVEQGNLPAALDSYQASLAIADRLAKADPGNAGWQRDLSVSQDKIGDVLRAQGNLPAALDSYQASLAVRDRLAKADAGNAGWQRDLSVSLNKIGDILVAQGQLVNALSQYRSALAIANRLSDADPGNAGWRRDLSISHNKIGDVLLAQGNLAEALTAFKTALAIAERLAMADPGNAGWQRDLSISHNKIGDVLEAQGDHAAALATFNSSLAIAERLANADSENAGWQRDLALSLGRVAGVEAHLGGRQRALGAFARGREIIGGLCSRSPDNAALRKDLSWFDSQIAELNT